MSAKTIYTAAEVLSLDWEVPGIAVVPEWDDTDQYWDNFSAWQKDIIAKFEAHNNVIMGNDALTTFMLVSEDFYDED